MQANLEQIITLIRKLPLEDFDKVSEIVGKEINARRTKNEEEISPKRALEILREFHDDFYNEQKDGFSQKELRNAVRWILTKYEQQQSQ